MAMGKRRLWRDYYAGPCLCPLHLTGHKNLSLESFVKAILFIKFVMICLKLVLLYNSLGLLPECECNVGLPAAMFLGMHPMLCSQPTVRQE